MSPTSQILPVLSDELAGAVQRAASLVVAVHAASRLSSSGVIWHDGVVITAAHTVRREEDIEITLPEGSRGRASLAGFDAGTDLAVLRADSALRAADWDAFGSAWNGLRRALGLPADTAAP